MAKIEVKTLKGGGLGTADRKEKALWAIKQEVVTKIISGHLKLKPEARKVNRLLMPRRYGTHAERPAQETTSARGRIKKGGEKKGKKA